MDERPSPGDEPDGMIAEGVGGGPMRPDEERIYGTDETAASDADDRGAHPLGDGGDRPFQLLEHAHLVTFSRCCSPAAAAAVACHVCG